MPFSVGQGYFKSSISAEKFGAIKESSRLPEMNLWEKIKAYFFSTYHAEALECIFQLYHYQELNLTAVQVRGAYIKLRELASQGCKEQFIIESQEHADELIIKDDNGMILLSIEVECHPEAFGLAKEINKLYPKEKNISLGDITRFVIFGDSLSDSMGRMFKKTHHILPSYGQYYGGRFTNEFTWPEFLSSPLFLSKEMINFAEGGSTSASYSCFNCIGDFVSNTDRQVASYSPSHQDLVIFLLGPNDYMTLHKDNVAEIVEQQIDDIEKVISGGVNNVLVMGIPNLSATPYGKHSDDKRKLKDDSIAHNALLKNYVEELKEKYPQHKICYFETTDAFKQITDVANGIGYDTENPFTHHGYVHIPGTKDPRLDICPQYVFNDYVHPTQEVHHCFAIMLESFIVNHYSNE
ncbi:type III secretion system effector [Salmonella enterica]|uniref:Type III secretion system effector n=4 Tax=Salmonella diarizonae TaxID=59204 RepID=A0A6Y1WBF8_SALDZ|nr:type III secretion system effector [Salmonella enterica]HAB4101261.1 type III secretion system effector [Salmonella enterica subsp. diarizonae]HAB4458225.1 type III secretion system effector [Salmonella enterica subsp. diarizonae]HDC2601989.1 type III secretion system effector [Salmonella enterica]